MSYEISSKSVVDKYGNLSFIVSLKNGDKITEKRMEPTAFAEVLLGSVKKEIKMIDVPNPDSLPECIKKYRLGSDGNKGTFEAIMVFPAGKRGFSFAGKIFFIPFPALVMKLTYVDGVRKGDRVFALDTDNPGPNSKLYNYPFGNVYEDGHICFGNIKLKIGCLEEAPRAFEDFINSVTTHDLHSSNRRSKKDMSMGEFVEMLEKMEHYPNEELVESSKSLKYFKEL